MLLKVIDKETKKVVWSEKHPEENIDQVINELKESNFNPKYFEFVKED